MNSDPTWTKERKYALVFGTALGLSASQIAKSMGDVSRNMIIGKWRRMKLKVPEKYHKGKSPMVKKGTRARMPAWSEAEDEALKQHIADRLTDWEISEKLPGRTKGAVTARRHIKNILKWPDQIRRFTPEDDAIIRADYAGFIDTSVTAKKLNRSNGVLRQRIMRLGLCRDGRKTRLANRYGIDILNTNDDPAEIVRKIVQQRAEEKAKRDADYEAGKVRALDAMDEALAAGVDRKTAFQAAMVGGATLNQIGKRQNPVITRERVRQIVYSVRPLYYPVEPTDIACASCGTTFTAYHRNQKYCSPECRLAAQGKRYSEAVKADPKRAQKAREYQKKYRAKHRSKLNTYNKSWMKRQRMTDDLLNLPPEQLALILRNVADEVGGMKAEVVQVVEVKPVEQPPPPPKPKRKPAPKQRGFGGLKRSYLR